MLKNWNHDLVHQLSEISDTLWRIDKYLEVSKGCGHCSTLWNQIRDDYEKHSAALIQEIKRHIQEKRFD